MRPQSESTSRTVLWLLLAAVYDLVNSNAKWQVQSAFALFDLSFQSCSAVSQMFLHPKSTSDINICLIKIVYNLLVTDSDDQLRLFVNTLDETFILDFVVYGSGSLRFLGLMLYNTKIFRQRSMETRSLSSSKRIP